jgi:hypothetical protein
MEPLPIRIEGMIGSFQYLIKDNSIGYLCGYLLIPPNSFYDNYEDRISCHGGITFQENNLYLDYNIIVMKKYDGHWIGFDCAHGGDLQHPDYLLLHPESRPLWQGEYKDEKYVFNELVNIAHQFDPNIQLKQDSIVMDKPDLILDLPF